MRMRCLPLSLLILATALMGLRRRKNKPKMKRTLVVLGAGASKDIYKPFPTGYELIREINYHLTTDKISPPRPNAGPYLSSLMNEIVRVFGDGILPSVSNLKTELWDEVLGYEWMDLRALNTPVPTIDHVIYERIQNNRLDNQARDVARFAIAYLIKGWEQALAESINMIRARSWIDVLFQKLKTYSFSDVLNNLTIVTFNYDRVFEHLAKKSIKKYFAHVSDEQIAQLISKKVCHIYGSLGTLEESPFALKNDETERMRVAYTKCNLMDYGTTKKEWADGVDFEYIYFLGFGYAEENLSRLNLDGFATAEKKGTDKNRKTDVAKLPCKIDLVDKTCLDFCEQDMNL